MTEPLLNGQDLMRTTLHPELIIREALMSRECDARGVGYEITSAGRGFEKQAAMFIAWVFDRETAVKEYGIASKPAPMGYSRHHRYFNGLAAAFDATPRVWSSEIGRLAKEQSKDPKELAREIMIEVARSVGLRCGADWNDPYHFELTEVLGEPIDTKKLYIALGKRLDQMGGLG